MKKGRDWKGGDIDGNKPGIVIVCCSQNKVVVEWESGARSECRWGYERCFDIEAIF